MKKKVLCSSSSIFDTEYSKNDLIGLSGNGKVAFIYQPNNPYQYHVIDDFTILTNHNLHYPVPRELCFADTKSIHLSGDGNRIVLLTYEQPNHKPVILDIRLKEDRFREPDYTVFQIPMLSLVMSYHGNVIAGFDTGIYRSYSNIVIYEDNNVGYQRVYKINFLQDLDQAKISMNSIVGVSMAFDPTGGHLVVFLLTKDSSHCLLYSFQEDAWRMTDVLVVGMGNEGSSYKCPIHYDLFTQSFTYVTTVDWSSIKIGSLTIVDNKLQLMSLDSQEIDKSDLFWIKSLYTNPSQWSNDGSIGIMASRRISKNGKWIREICRLKW